MLRELRLMAVRHGVVALGMVVVAGYGLSLWSPTPARASASVEKWRKVALSDVALNLRMMALEHLKKDGSSEALSALEEVAKEGALPIQTAACAQLGRVQSSGSKAKLKSLLEDSRQSTEVRMAAAASIAEHWRDEGDLSYLETKCSGNSALSAHCGVIRSRVYGR